MGSKGKACFFEKKQQKTFDCSGFGLSGEAEAKRIKVFWFFFSKKNCFLPSIVGTSDFFGRLGVGFAGLALLLAAVAEPSTYRQSDYRAAVPDTLHGATVMHTEELARLLAQGHPVLIDVLPAPVPPPNRPAGMPWMPLPHTDLPGSIWLAGTGRGTLDPATEAWFAARVRAAALAHPDEALVFYCLSHCWMSWNAARRAVLLGVPHVVWYPDGADGWAAAGHALAPAVAEHPPGGY